MLLLVLAASCSQSRFYETAEERLARERLELLEDNADDAEKRLKQMLTVTPITFRADSMLRRYYENGGEWLWATTDTTFLLNDADTLAALIAEKAADIGLPQGAFAADSIRRDIVHFRTLDFDSTGVVPADAMARVELGLSRALLRMAVGLRYGFVDPHSTFNHLDKRGNGGYRRTYDIELEHPTQEFVKEVFLHTDDAIDYLNTLESTDSIYQRLKQRLTTSSTAADRKLVVCNMERRRWRHKFTPTKGQRYVFVNIPSQQLWAISPDSVFSMKICCGAWATKTPLLSSKVRLIQLNPEWRIPFAIMRDEVSRHAGDVAYFNRHSYFITKNSTGDTISPRSVTAEQLAQGGYTVTQRSGAHNALGRMIFRFQNKFDVFMHDTNNRNAFNAERRTLSHGCVRLERPFDMAMFLLPDADEWLLDRMRMTIDLPPQSDRGKEYLAKKLEEEASQEAEDGEDGEKPKRKPKPIRFMSSQTVSPGVPVFIDYYTLFPNPETGGWDTWRDRYEYDEQIMRQLQKY